MIDYRRLARMFQADEREDMGAQQTRAGVTARERQAAEPSPRHPCCGTALGIRSGRTAELSGIDGLTTPIGDLSRVGETVRKVLS